MNFDLMIEVSPVGYAQVSREGVVQYANQALCGFLGYSGDELLLKNFAEITYPQDIDSDRNEFERLLNHEIDQYRLQKRYIHKTGEVLWGDLFVTRIPADHESEEDMFLASVVDITDAKNKEIKLQEEKQNFQSMFQHNPLAMVIYSMLDYSVLEVNQAACNMSGYCREELLQMKATDFIPGRKQQQFTAFLAQTDAEKNYGEIWEMIRKGGDVLFVQTASHKINYNGQAARHALLIDITQQQETLRALSESEDLLSHAELLAGMGSWEWNAQTKKITYSDNLYKLYDLDPSEDPSPDHWLQKIHKEDRLQIDQVYQNMLARKEEIVFEFRLNSGREKVKWFESYIKPEFDKDGKLLRIRGVSIDVTERKARENELLKLSQAMEQSPISIAITDREGKIQYINPKFTAITGYSKEEALRQNPRILKSGKMNEAVYDELWKTIVSGKTWEGELLNKNKQGAYYWENAVIAPIVDDHGAITNYVGLKEDITAQKRLMRTRDVIVSISNAVLESDDLESFFDHFFSSLGQLTTTQNFFVAIYDADRQIASIPYVKDQFQSVQSEFKIDKTFTGRVIRTGKPLFIKSQEIAELVLRGEINRIGTAAESWLGVPLTAKEGVIGVLGLQSYTGEPSLNQEDLLLLESIAPQLSLAFERKRTIENLREALSKAQESERLKSSFLATMSHELRTPLNPIIGFSNLLLEENHDSVVQEFLEYINESGNEMLRLLEDIFELAFHRGLNVQCNRRPVRVVDLYNESRQYLEEALFNTGKLKKIQIQMEDRSVDLYREIELDKEKILQILAILFNNAAKFTPQGTIIFKIELTENPEGIHFEVRDTGIGMDQEKIDLIFDDFRQLDDTHARRYSGLGIGLTIAKILADITGSQLSVRSVVGEGSCFSLEVPGAIRTRKVNSLELVEPDQVVDPVLEGKTILVVDDNHFIYELIKCMLSQHGVKLVYAANGKEAIECSRREAPDFILMDLVMPVMDGIEATRQIRTFLPAIPIAALTAHLIWQERRKVFEAGFDTIISKPMHKGLLLWQLKSFLQHQGPGQNLQVAQQDRNN